MIASASCPKEEKKRLFIGPSFGKKDDAAAKSVASAYAGDAAAPAKDEEQQPLFGGLSFGKKEDPPPGTTPAQSADKPAGRSDGFLPESSSAPVTPASTTEQGAPTATAKADPIKTVAPADASAVKPAVETNWKTMSGWRCGVCIFENPGGRVKCVACGERNPNVPEEAEIDIDTVKPATSNFSFGLEKGHTNVVAKKGSDAATAAAKPDSASAASPAKDEKKALKPLLSGLSSFGKKEGTAAKLVGTYVVAKSTAAPAENKKKPLFSGLSFGKKQGRVRVRGLTFLHYLGLMKDGVARL